MNTPIFIVYHIYPHNSWKEHVQDKFNKINKYKLFEKILEMHCVIVKPKNEDIEWLQKECLKNNLNKKIKILKTEENNFEHESIKLVKEIGDNNDGFILYFHTKGSSKEKLGTRKEWDTTMSYTVIEKWENCLKVLETHNCVGSYLRGVNFKKTLHFSGNFWWARCDYIKKLPIIEKPNLDRYYYEFWIGLINNTEEMKPFCPHEYSQKERYKNVETTKFIDKIDFTKNYYVN
jgi:hypothetical protein